MEINFWKYHGTGNDFVMIDDRDSVFPDANKELVVALCHRRFGIGSDGLILIRNHAEYDFEMIFFNPDGSQSFCGNGSRCAVAFARDIGIKKEQYRFLSTDGSHEAYLLENGEVKLSMHSVQGYTTYGDDLFIHTGSPHYIRFCEKLDEVDLIAVGRAVRYGDLFKSKGGTNVNFVQVASDRVRVRTYERGVEDETWSCGTGVTAVALASAIKYAHTSPVNIAVKGGDLKVFFTREGEDRFSDIWLQGPAQAIFKGQILMR